MKSPIWKPFTIQIPESEQLKVVRGEGLYLYLDDNRKLMDMISSWWVNLHGHAHPEIARAISVQAGKLEQVIFADFTHDPAETLANDLIKITDGDFHKVFFSDNGSTAVEVAIKLALQYWKNQESNSRNEIIAFEGAYHGDTLGAMSVGGESIFSQVFDEWMFQVYRIPFPSTWENDGDVKQKEQDILNNLKSLLDENPERYAAIILEPLVQGAGGMNMCRPEFIDQVCSLVRRHGILVIFDEVMTGFGRTGALFAYQKTTTKPDLIALSKGITGGFIPLAVTMVSENIYNQFYTSNPVKTFWHGHSYTANPLGCAAGNASLKLLMDAKSPVFSKIENWHQLFSKDLKTNPRVKKFRLCGTIAAFNIETQMHTGYLNRIGATIKSEAMKYGIFLRPLGDTIYLMPPYCITEDELKYVYARLNDIIHALK